MEDLKTKEKQLDEMEARIRKMDENKENQVSNAPSVPSERKRTVDGEDPEPKPPVFKQRRGSFKGVLDEVTDRVENKYYY